ncbi:hypothetical protein Lepto7375DRAFT_1773 [Leptolyngbya sp. PCC 7375]|nr:hypothetical protein Lepto7375DRAFT_1773 [Leptolyngbya sp. PCC 7375]
MQKIFEQAYAGTVNRVFVVDEPGQGNGCHQYRTEIEADGAEFYTETNFQKGPVQEVGLNGIQNEHLLAMVIHRLQGFQSGPYACNENAQALASLQKAMQWMEARTKDRSARKVEGLNQK